MFDNDTEISLPPGTPPTSMSPDLYLKDPLLNINKKVWRTVVLTPSSTCRLQVVYSCFFSFVVLDAINDKMKEEKRQLSGMVRRQWEEFMHSYAADELPEDEDEDDSAEATASSRTLLG